MKNILTQKYIDNIHQMCDRFDIFHYEIRNDGKVDVQQSVYMKYAKFKKFPIKFGRIDGDFDCTGSAFTSLEGAPEYVRGSFTIQSLKCTSLEGCPEVIGGNFNCVSVPITSLEYSPKHIGGYIDLRHSRIPNLIGLTNNVLKVNCGEYNGFISLEGCPETLEGFSCISGGITSLEYSPKTVKNYTIMTCVYLKSLDGIPKEMDTVMVQFCRDLKNTSIPYSVKCNVGNLKLHDIPEINDLTLVETVLFLKYQPYYDIWNEDGTLNSVGFDDFKADLAEGLA